MGPHWLQLWVVETQQILHNRCGPLHLLPAAISSFLAQDISFRMRGGRDGLHVPR